ncbi:MAG: outer membrane beta-barrel protein [Vicinamibacterales bacterium]
MRSTLKTFLYFALLSLPASAAAQSAPSMAPARSWYVAPFLGATTGGDTTNAGATTGVSIGWLGAGWLGVEAEVAHTPHFFEQTGFLTDRSVTTGMGTVLVSSSGRRIARFYVAGGFGVIAPTLREAGDFAEVTTQQRAMNVGGGVMTRPMERVGLRADIRYFRAVGDKEDDANAFNLEVSQLKFWRASGALVVWF